MGNKQLTSPVPQYETASTKFSATDLSQLRKKFHDIRMDKLARNCYNFLYLYSEANEVIRQASFTKKLTPKSSEYMIKYVLPRVFTAVDTKKTGALDYEEYVCAVALFRFGTREDKLKLVYMMYDGHKGGGYLTKDNFRQLLIDATICVQKEQHSLKMIEDWIADLEFLSDAMVETALAQFSTHNNKLDVQEFLAFVKMEGTVLGFLNVLTSLIDE